MDDLISRQAAISEIMEDLEDRSLHDDPATPEDFAEGYDEGIRNAAAIVLQMPSTQQTGTKTVQVDDCISREAALTALERDEEYDKDIPNRADGVRDAIITISALPSAQPEPMVTITYQICVASMLKMWMDDVLTDSEYSRIMNKLNTWYRTEGCQEE